MTRQPAHLRNGRVTGNINNINAKAIKVLAKVKFSSKSLSREDIVEETSLTSNDVERQVKLLLGYKLVKLNSRFPMFPQQGWKIFTLNEKHLLITRLLKSKGYENPLTEQTREILGDYYPTGLDLEGDGIQQFGGFTYTEGHPIIPELEFRTGAIKVMKEFRDRIKPFRPKVYSEAGVEEKKIKWSWFVQKMCEVYRIPLVNIKYGVISEDSWNRPGSSYSDDNRMSSSYNSGTNTLFFTGKFSLVTLLHEFGHARGFDERDTIIWSNNIFKRFFPVTFNRLMGTSNSNSHVLIQRTNQDNFNLGG